MPISAVPDYLGRNFETASPGMRFGMYLKAWESNWEKSKNKPLEDAKRFNDNDKKTMAALKIRQKHAFDTAASSSTYRIDALAIAPFTTGLGNEHPSENGFAFLNPYGLPYLPGSGVKGVLRQAARELATGDWGDGCDWNETALTALFGREGNDGDTEHLRGALSFWDVIPQIKGDQLHVEIMTPHQKHYYQGDDTPHDSGQPIPITFLTVPPGAEFPFHVICDLQLLARTAPELAEGEVWKELLQAVFKHAFDWLGFGAKTAVGYGQMADKEALAQAQADAQAQSLREAGINVETTTWRRARIVATNPGSGQITIRGDDGKQASGNQFGELTQEARSRLKKKKTVFVDARIEEKGNLIDIKSITEVD